MTIRTKIVRIGNSQGLRLSKPLLEAAGISGEVDVDARNGEIVIQPVRMSREGWDLAFAEMAEKGDDRLLITEELASAFDESEWEWHPKDQ